MKELVFQVEFLSDIVLPATSNTEGNIEQLDFIPGSNFLGMVARQYSEFEDSFQVFHSGAVRFGDANILTNNKQTYKMPLSYFHEKLDKSNIYNHHHIEDFNKFNQLKQCRNGYITKDLEVIYIDYNYSQKSAYDKTKRKSKDSSMFGYNAIRKGTKWQFTLNYTDISSSDLERIKSSLIGINRLGKSKSAQYGEVEISIQGENKDIQNKNRTNETILYTNSRLALIDESANPTYDLKYLCKGLEDKNIVYNKTQLRTSTFTPYNGARETKDYERAVISKGSVIVLKDITDEQLASLKQGVGMFLSEGFGELMINPSFLDFKENKFDKTIEKNNATPKVDIKSDLAKFLKQREDDKKAKLDILSEVDRFIKENNSLYKKIKPSQWGTVRSICTARSDNFKNEIKTYISSGKVAWSEKQIELLCLDSDSYSLEFIKLIAIQMPKTISQKKESKDEN